MEALSVYHAHPLDGYRQARDIPTDRRPPRTFAER